MNNKTIWYVVGAIVVVVILGFVFMRKPAANEGDSLYQNQTGQKTSLKSLLAAGTSQKCTYANESGGAKSEGTVYVSNDKMRTDFTVTTGSNTMQSHMLVMGDTSYMWGDGMTGGIKMSFADAGKSQSAGQAGSIDPNQEFGYSCERWSENASTFSLPTGIKFTDLSAMMGGY